MHGPNVMKGYYNLEEDTREAIDADGWLHTGDIVQIDADGFIAITDRKKEIIVLSGGKNVSPANLESRLAERPVYRAGVRDRRSAQASGGAAGAELREPCGTDEGGRFRRTSARGARG